MLGLLAEYFRCSISTFTKVKALKTSSAEDTAVKYSDKLSAPLSNRLFLSVCRQTFDAYVTKCGFCPLSPSTRDRPSPLHVTKALTALQPVDFFPFHTKHLIILDETKLSGLT